MKMKLLAASRGVTCSAGSPWRSASAKPGVALATQVESLRNFPGRARAGWRRRINKAVIATVLLVSIFSSNPHEIFSEEATGASAKESPSPEKPLHPWQGTKGQFAPDKYTLLLAHFDKEQNLNIPDYANGYEKFIGAGLLSAQGYYGNCLDISQLSLHQDYFTKSDAGMPYYVDFGIWPFGNFNVYQGTLEFWFMLKNDKMGEFINVFNGLYPAKITMSPGKMNIKWSCLKNKTVEGSVSFPKPLELNQWHYYTQTWSDGEFAVYIDGQLAFAFNMEGCEGIVRGRVDKTSFTIGSDTIKRMPLMIDELAVSGVVRYTENFEPRWVENKRPAWAFAGLNRAVPRYPIKETEPITAEAIVMPASPEGEEINFDFSPDIKAVFDKKDGFIKGVKIGKEIIKDEAGGIMLWEGLDRKPLFGKTSASHWKNTDQEISFTQRYAKDLILMHKITKEGNAAKWNLTIKNSSAEEKRLEVLLSLPLPFAKSDEYFDGTGFHADTSLPRRRDDIAYSIPLGAASANGYFVGLATDPHIWLSALVNEWVPLEKAGVIRQGFKYVIHAKDSHNFNFIILDGKAPFKCRNALEAYYETYPDLYAMRKDIPVHFNMPIGMAVADWSWSSQFSYSSETGRKIYCGHGWCPQPNYGFAGDDYGQERFFNNPKYYKRPEYQPARKKIETMFKSSLEYYRECSREWYKKPYEHLYTRPAFHWCPQWPNPIMCEELYPEGMNKEGDRLQNGQYYASSYALCINDYNTPIGRNIMEQVDQLDELRKKTNAGFVNDLAYNSSARHTDPIARKTKGRAFARDKGAYLIDAFGFAQIFEHIKSKKLSSDIRLGICADGGFQNYIIASVADKVAVEWGTLSDGYTLEGRWEMGRILNGEKPYETLSSKVRFKDISAVQLEEFDELSERQLRDYYRYYYDQYFLNCMKHGIMAGNNYAETGILKYYETRPLAVECQLAGYRIVPGARVKDSLFVARYGKDMATKIIVGNHKPFEQKTDVEIHNPSLGDKTYVFGDYYGNPCRMEIKDEKTVIRNIGVEKRFIRGFKALAHLQGDLPQAIEVSSKGNGIEFLNSFLMEADKDINFMLTPETPKDYRIETMMLDGKEIKSVPANLKLAKGTHKLEINYHHAVLNFSPAEWEAAELINIKDNKVLFQVVTNDNAGDFDMGTAQWLNTFVYVYDYEDNVKGNLTPNKIATGSSSINDWKIYLGPQTKEEAQPTAVTMDSESKTIRVAGANERERRRAMAIFMRLVDRKYPCIGSYLPPQKLVPLDRLNKMEKKLLEIFEKYDFYLKPLLTEEYETLYENDNLNFQGKYAIKNAPYIFEPVEWE